MSEQWFYRLFGEEFGPVLLSDLRELAANGTLSGDDQVRPATISIWVSSKSVCELQDIYQTTAIESDSSVVNSTSPAADEWYYQQPSINDAVTGPMTFEALLEQAKSGRLSADDEVKFGVDGKWRRAGSMGRLVAVLPYRSAPRNIQAAPKPTPVTPALSIDDLEDAPSDAIEEASLETDVADLSVIERKKTQPKAKAVNGKKERPTSVKGKPKAQEEFHEDDVLAELLASPTPAEIDAAKESQDAQSKSQPAMTAAQAPAFVRPPEPAPMSAASYAPSTPRPVAPSKPVPRFKPARSDSSVLAKLKDPAILKLLPVAAGLLLVVGWFSMPESNAGDVTLYNELNNLITEVRTKRAQDPKSLPQLKDELDKAADRIVKKLEKTADGDHPARQRLLWCAKTTVPQMTKVGLATEALAEKQVIAQLDQTAVLLGLKPAPPPVAVAELVTD